MNALFVENEGRSRSRMSSELGLKSSWSWRDGRVSGAIVKALLSLVKIARGFYSEWGSPL